MTAAEVVTTGEALIDFVSIEAGVSLVEAPAFEKAPGGAPANVAAALARLGIPAAFLGKVGQDAFGQFIAGVLSEAGVDTSGLIYDPAARTALAFVSLRTDGERDFMFYRHPSADMLLRTDEVAGHADTLRAARILHFGSISLIADPSRSATLAAIELFRQGEGARIVSYDPNYRPPLWHSDDVARQGMLIGWQQADVIKVSLEELAFIAGDDGLMETAIATTATLVTPEPSAALLAQVALVARRHWTERLLLVAVTMGAQGCWYSLDDRSTITGYLGGFPVQAVDTTGAGDAFTAGLLAGILPALRSKLLAAAALESLDAATWERIFRFANAAGARTTLRRGAIPALPSLAEVTAMIERI